MDRRQAGFTITELLVTVFITGLVLAGLTGVLRSQTKTYTQQDGASALVQNLRVGTDALADALRESGYGIPPVELSAWIPWVSGFTSNPWISSSTPATVSIARCSQLPVAKLSAAAAETATVLEVVSAVAGKGLTDLLDTNQKRLVVIDGREHAHVKLVTGTSITIDTHPTDVGNQGLQNAYPAGAPLCRVDVLTFQIQPGSTLPDGTIDPPRLVVDENQGQGASPVAEGISDLRVTTVTAGRRYQISLRAQTVDPDPWVNQVVTRTLRSTVTLRN